MASGDSGNPDDGQSNQRVAVDSHVATYREDDELTVVADLPGVDRDELEAGIVDATTELVVAVDGSVVERISQPWDPVAVAGAKFTNGILEVRLRPVDED